MVSHQQLIRYVALYEEFCPHIAFPKKLLWKCTFTIFLFFLFVFLLAFPILAGVVTFLVLYGGYYIAIFFGLLRTLSVSRWKYTVFLSLLATLAYAVAQAVHSGVAFIIH